MIVTHHNVDSDNVVATCVALILHNKTPSEVTVRFAPASTRTVPAGDLAIDIAASKHADGKSFVSSHYASHLPPEVVEEVIEQDTTGKSTSRISIAGMISALRQINYTDLQILQFFYPLVRGWMQTVENRRNAEAILPTVPTAEIGGHTFLVLDNRDIPPIVGFLANERGVAGSIYRQGNNMGITRYPGRETPDLTKLSLPGWFTHRAGFLFCWGSRKSPAESPPPQFETVGMFIQWLREALK